MSQLPIVALHKKLLLTGSRELADSLRLLAQAIAAGQAIHVVEGMARNDEEIVRRGRVEELYPD